MIYYMVTGKNAAGTLINAGQTLTRMEALRLYTANNGWFLREEDRLGSIEPGKLGGAAVQVTPRVGVRDQAPLRFLVSIGLQGSRQGR